MQVTNYQKECILKCADAMYGMHELKEIYGDIDNEVLASIAMLYLEESFEEIEEIDVIEAELVVAFNCIESVFNSGIELEEYNTDKICLEFADGSILAHTEDTEENELNELNDYQYFTNITEFQEEFELLK